jgi:2-polyprenyl-6-hydroxyphenyl methylase/3-demethylubiquinone-9 3-methyltransferase
MEEHFDTFKKDWWATDGRLKSLHTINPLRFGYFSDKAEAFAEGLVEKRVLDIGCGGGILSESFAKAGAVVTGIDLASTAIEAASEHASEGELDIEYKVCTVSELAAERKEYYDCIACSEVVEHVDDLEGFLKDALSMLKPGGLFFFSTINKTLRARFLAVFVAEDILRMIPPGTHDYARFVRPSELVRILRDNSVEAEEIKGMSFNPLSFEFRISKDTSVNYLGFAVKSL